MRWSSHSGLRTCFATLSTSFRGLSYRVTMDEVGALAKYFTGWTRSDLMGMSVRERRHWMNWSSAVVNKQRRDAEQQRWLQQQQVQYYGK
jgi:hypothetical protein